MSTSLTGRLLIASPYLTDGHFLRSLVFIIRHDDEGAFGLMINRSTGRRMRDVFDPQAEPDAIRVDDEIFLGGPVEGPLLALHDLSGVGDPCGIVDALTGAVNDPTVPAWITGDEDHFRVLLQRADRRARFIASYSGWGPGQLDEEIRRGGWLHGRATPGLLFGDPDSVWEEAVKSCGHEILTRIAPGVQFGDPNLN